MIATISTTTTTTVNGLETILAIFADGITAKSLRAARQAFRAAYGRDRAIVTMDNVPQKDGSVADELDYRPADLFSAAESNTKLAMSDALTDRYETIGLSLAPSTTNGLKTARGNPINFCSHASAICEAICLFGTGHARVSRGVRRARIGKSRMFVKHAKRFKAQMLIEIAKHHLAAQKRGRQLVVRLNVFADIVWERQFPALFTTFSQVQFYDYSKVPNRVGKTPANYFLIFSRSESNEDIALEYLRSGRSITVVFENHDFQPTWHGYPVIDGTTHDLRFLDPSNVVVGLAEKNQDLRGPRYKGKANTAKDTSGFVLPTATSNAFGQALSPL